MSNSIKITLSLAAFLCATAVFSIFGSIKLQGANEELIKTNTMGLEYQTFKSKWLNKDGSKKIIDDLTAEMGKGYFSAVITKKELKGDIYTVGIMVLNSDEFDGIINRILGSNLKINKLDIVNNDVGYLIDLEVTL